MFNQYSSLKAAWHLDKIAQLRARRDIVPTHLQLIISDLCNQDCDFCAYRMSGGFSTELFSDESGNKNPKRMIPTEKVEEILRDAAELGVEAIQFTGGGEPTVHPSWVHLIEFAQNLGLKTALVTNGIRLRPCAALEQLDWLRISLDAATPATYEHIRRHKGWDKAMAGLELAAQLQKPLVGVGFVVTGDNWHEIVEAAILVKNKGIPYIRYSAVFSDAGEKFYAGIQHLIRDQLRAASELEDAKFSVVDNFGARIEDLQAAAPDYRFCGYQQFTLYIGGDQRIYTCCTNSYTTRGMIGDLKHQGFKEWLVSHRRFDFNARQCHHCQFNSQNRVINYMVKEPLHKEFV